MELELRHCTFRYRQLSADEPAPPALVDVSLRLQAGECVGIVGASGSGKTTLIQLFNGLLRPETGEVLVDGKPAEYSGPGVLNWRRRVGLVFQFPELQFFEETVAGEVAFALRNLGVEAGEIDSKVEKALTLLGLSPGEYAQRSPFLLSEGQKRRVAIASVLVMEPEILVLDEPTAGLDYGGVQIVKNIVQKLCARDRTVVLVSHDMDFIAELVSRMIVLSGGRIVFDGPKGDFFQKQPLVEQTGLEIPRILKVGRRLRQSGFELPDAIFSLEELKKHLMKLRG